MPELPEVETIRRDLQKKIVGKTIQKVHILAENSVKNKRDYFISSLEGNSVTTIERVGKLLIFSLQKHSLFLLVHLKMTGKLLYSDEGNSTGGGHSLTPHLQSPEKFNRVIVVFEGNSQLVFQDMRRFGYMKIVSASELEKIKSNFGIEPLTPSFTLPAFEKIFHKRKAPLKAVLLDQKLISGLGNIYVDEVSFAAKVHPGRAVHLLSSQELGALFEACTSILKQAVEHRGTTFYSYVDATGQKGNYFGLLAVYKRQGKPCRVCGTAIVKTRLSGRGTHFCPTCQK